MTPKPARTLVLALLALALAALLSPAGASAKRSAVPTVSSVAPMRLAIGDTLTIRGRNFRAGRNRNTVVFKRDGQRAVFVKAAEATQTRLRLIVPAKLAPYLSHSSKSGAARPTRFRLRVLSSRFGRAFTATKLSPVIAAATPAPTKPTTGGGTTITIRNGVGQQVVPAVDTDPDCDGDGARNSADADDDNDFLPDTLERTLGTSTCNADTDGDGMQDGWEYQSATDLNRISCPAAEYPVPCTPAQPYPKKRNYPNPLDGSDAGRDFDRDSLTAYQEYSAWVRQPGHDIASGLWYSDGLQSSVDSDPSDGCRGQAVPTLTIPASLQTPLPSSASWLVPAAYEKELDLNGNGCLSDDERDADGDWLTNWDELTGRMSGLAWWNGVYEETARDFGVEGTDWLDADTDGDGVLDAFDDQDDDDFLNIEELERGTPSVWDGTTTGATTGLWVNPFSPCMPWKESRTCELHRPIGDKSTPYDDDATNKWPLWGDHAPYDGDDPTGDHLIALPH